MKEIQKEKKRAEKRLQNVYETHYKSNFFRDMCTKMSIKFPMQTKTNQMLNNETKELVGGGVEMVYPFEQQMKLI